MKTPPKQKKCGDTGGQSDAWKAEVKAAGDTSLFSQAKSWYMGANIPGKTVEMLYYFGGIVRWREACTEALGPEFEELFVCHDC